MTADIAELPPEGMELVGVALDGDFEPGTLSWGLNLVFTSAGITVHDPRSQAESLVAWLRMDRARCAERLVLPDGRNAAVLELTSDGLSLRFLLPADTVTPGQAAYLEKALPEWLALYKSAPVAVPVPVVPPPTFPVVVNTAEPVAVVAPPDAGASNGHLAPDLWSAPGVPSGPDPVVPPGVAARHPSPPGEQAPVSAPLDLNGGAEASKSVGEKRQPAAKDRRSNVVLAVLLVAALNAATIYIVKTDIDSRGPATSAAPVRAALSLAESINLRAGDLPAGWGPVTAAASTPPPAGPSVLLNAEEALASCLQQPLPVVQGWFASTAFPGQITAVTSQTFQSASDPTLQMVSTTKVMQSPADARLVTAPFVAPNFATCFDQYQVASVAEPITAQVQPEAMNFPVPAGVDAYIFLTTLTLSNHQSQVVEDAFIVGGRTATVLRSSASGLSIPSADFTSACQAVIGRVAVDG